MNMANHVSDHKSIVSNKHQFQTGCRVTFYISNTEFSYNDNVGLMLYCNDIYWTENTELSILASSCLHCPWLFNVGHCRHSVKKFFNFFKWFQEIKSVIDFSLPSSAQSGKCTFEDQILQTFTSHDYIFSFSASWLKCCFWYNCSCS